MMPHELYAERHGYPWRRTVNSRLAVFPAALLPAWTPSAAIPRWQGIRPPADQPLHHRWTVTTSRQQIGTCTRPAPVPTAAPGGTAPYRPACVRRGMWRRTAAYGAVVAVPERRHTKPGLCLITSAPASAAASPSTRLPGTPGTLRRARQTSPGCSHASFWKSVGPRDTDTPPLGIQDKSLGAEKGRSGGRGGGTRPPPPCHRAMARRPISRPASIPRHRRNTLPGRCLLQPRPDRAPLAVAGRRSA